jgi:hypothetical protein
MATPKDGNPLWTLFILYFVLCDFMHQHHIRLKDDFFSNPKNQERVGQEFAAFTLYWFTSLFVVVEGWKELALSDPEINKMINEHWDSLRIFRNAVFHLQPEERKHKQFFVLDKFNWAKKLHASLRTFFMAHENKP